MNSMTWLSVVGVQRWWGGAMIVLAALLAAQEARAQCSPYAGQVTINELRIGASGSRSTSNQVELFNSANVAQAVWSTWRIVVWSKRGTSAPRLRGTYTLSSGFTASGQFIYNNNKSMYLRNRTTRLLDVALVDANGLFIDYIAIGGAIQTVPACLGAPKVVSASSSSDASGDLPRLPDGGAWPNAVIQTTAHSIGATNVCTLAGNDLVVQNAANLSRAVINSTTLTYTVTVTNKNCSNGITAIALRDTGVSTTDFSNLTYSASQGSTTQSAGWLSWSVGNLAAGASATLTITGRPKLLGTLITTAALTAPTTGLVNTSDDTSTASVNVVSFNYVGFDVATDSVTEGTDTLYSAVISATVKPEAKITVNYTVSGTAVGADTDLPLSGSVVIDPADPDDPDLTTIDFTIKNDALVEPTKSIVLTITSVTSTDVAVVLDSAANAMNITLFDDDSGVDHYELALATSGVSCAPSTVTVTACANSSSPCTSPLTTIAGGTAALATSGGTLGAISITFNAAGVASTTLSHPLAANGTAVSVTLSGESVASLNPRQCCPNGTGCVAANSCSITYNTAGFIVAAAAGGGPVTVPAQIAGTASGSYVLRAVRTNTTTQACEAALNGATTVNWAYQCNNPTTCSAGNLMTVNGGSATPIAGNPNAAVTSNTAVPMTFDANGNAPFTFTYNDVGQVTLWASKTVNGAPLAGASNAFVTRPAGFTLSNIQQSAAPNLANPAAANASGPKFVKAGEAFSATVSAVSSTGAVTPNYGRETIPEGVALPHTLVAPAGGAAGTLSNSTIAGASFGNGMASVTNLSFSEVGIITLTPGVADGSYLGAGNVAAVASGNVGRFIPARFALGAASVTHRAGLACTPASAFTYLGENFSLGFTLTAQNSAGATTQNYHGGFAKFDLASAGQYNLAGLGGTTSFSTGSGRLSLASASGTWSNGVASAISITAQATRAAAPDGPFNAQFGIAPVDSDGVAMAAYNMASVAGGANDRTSLTTLDLRFGRLRLANAVGAQTRPLALPLIAQVWNGSYFDVNSLDSCTSIPASAVSLGNLRKTLTTSDTALAGASFALTSGVGAVRLGAPAAGHSGSVDVTLSLGGSAVDASCLQPWTPGAGDAATAGANLSFLRGAWCGAAYDKDPSARASFGLYRGADSVLYQRENY